TDSSFNKPQLQAARPGLIKSVFMSVAGSARSVPNVDSMMVAREPIAITRQGDANGSFDSASNARSVNTSGVIGTPILYSPPSENCCRRDAWKLPSMPASVINNQCSPVLNNAGKAQPASVGDAVPTGISRS